MKNTIILANAIILSILLASCFRNHDVKITANESEDEYKFSAYYDESRTRDVQRYVNRSIKPNGLFSGEDDRLDIDTRLQDGTTFKLKSSPGELIIRVDKTENKPESVQRIREMCQGLKDVITGD